MKKNRLILIVIFIFAFTVRIYQLSEIPYVIYGDEAVVGQEAWLYSIENQINIFSTGHWGIPKLFFYFASIVMRFFGDNLFGLRMFSMLGGMAAVVSFYLLLKELYFGNKFIQLIGLLIFSASGYHIHFSRIGIGQIHDSFFITALLVAILKYNRSGKIIYIIIAGLIAGLSQYFFFGTRVIPLILFFWLLFGLTKIKFIPRIYIIVLFFTIFFILYFPLKKSEHISGNGTIGRFKSESIFKKDWIKEKLNSDAQINTIQHQLLSPIKVFITGGDHGYFYLDYINRPLMGTIIVPFLIFGFFAHVIRKKNISITLPWLFVSLFFNGMIMNTTPQSQRFILLLPLMFIFVLEGFCIIRGLFRRKIIPAFIIVLIGALIIFQEINFYFADFTNNRIYACDKDWQMFTVLSRNLSGKKDIETMNIYFLVNGFIHYNTHSGLSFMLRKSGININNIIDIPESDNNFLLLGNLSTIDNLQKIESLFPNGYAEYVRNGRDEIIGWMYIRR